MSGVEVVEYNGEIIAIVVRSNYNPEGVNFVTSKDSPLQLGIFCHKKNSEIKPHIHKEVEKVIKKTLEVLHIEYGRVSVDLYSSDGKKIKTITLNGGDNIMFVSGGHGIKILEDSKIIEIKQGPYYGVEVDKEYI